MSKSSQKPTNDLIQEMVRRIVDGFHPQKIILFGSHARGEAGPGNDMDLLVVMPVARSKLEMQIEFRVAVHDIHVANDIIVATLEEVERKKDLIGTIARSSVKEWILLYAR